jgi:hypothetical protein
MRPARWLAAAISLAVCAAACTSAPVSAPSPEPTTLAGYYAQRLDWQPCDGGFECAQLVVPFDYAQLFPHRVRALVLDGAVDPDASSLQATIDQAEGFQTAFGSFAAWCLASAGCPLGPGGPVASRNPNGTYSTLVNGLTAIDCLDRAAGPCAALALDIRRTVCRLGP